MVLIDKPRADPDRVGGRSAPLRARLSLGCKPRLQAAGFTLLELIVVIAIMAILTAVITPRINFNRSEDLASDEIRRLGELFRLASDDSVFKRRELGVLFSSGDYRFLVLDGDGREGKWVVLEEEQRFRQRELEERLNVELEISGVGVALEDADDVKIDEKTRPQIMFLSNGEIMPDFRLSLDTGVLDSQGWQLATGVEELLEIGPLDEES